MFASLQVNKVLPQIWTTIVLTFPATMIKENPDLYYILIIILILSQLVFDQGFTVVCFES